MIGEYGSWEPLFKGKGKKKREWGVVRAFFLYCEECA
jgi:hypothetical protein